MGLPWVVMGVGILSGDVSTVFDYFRPKEGNIYVLAFFGVLFFEYTLGTLWLFARGGAEVLAKHPGFIQMRGTKTKDITNPTQIKIFWLLCLIGGVAAFFMMWHSNIEIPKFR